MPKHNLKLVAKKLIGPKTYLAIFQTTQINNLKPGNLFSFLVADKTYRSYSLVDYSHDPLLSFGFILPILDTSEVYLTFLISTKMGGVGSQFFEKLGLNQEAITVGPTGKFGLSTNLEMPKAFICTGTGIAPFYGMVKKALLEAREKSLKINIKLLFGTDGTIANWAFELFKPLLEEYKNLELHSCYWPDKEKIEIGKFEHNATVTKLLPELIKNPKDYEYYLCGNAFMVADVKKELIEKCEVNTNNIIQESFSLPVK